MRKTLHPVLMAALAAGLLVALGCAGASQAQERSPFAPMGESTLGDSCPGCEPEEFRMTPMPGMPEMPEMPGPGDFGPRGMEIPEMKTDVQFTLRNDTSFWLVLYIDGLEACKAPPYLTCSEFLKAGDRHSFRAVEEENPRNSVSRTVVMPEGDFTWTVFEK